MFHESHASISRPALLVVVANNILVVGVRMFGEVPLNELPSLLSCEPANRHRESRCQGGWQGTVSPEEDVHTVHVARVQSYGVAGLGVHVLVGEEVVGHLRRSRHLAGSLETQHQEIQHQSVVLDYERRKLQSSYYPIRVGVVHILHTGSI